jgi:sarcosine oxidase subunit beta
MSLDGDPMPEQAETVVIGAGLVGCSIAYQLAKRGRQVLVLEARGVCSGASGRNGGMTGAGSALHAAAGKAVYSLTRENLRMLSEELPRELGDDFSLRLSGTLDLATTEEQYDHLVTSVRAQQVHGLAVRLLDRHEVRELVPVASDRILGARLSEEGGHLWPFRLVHALARGAQYHGARIVTWTPVTRIVSENGRVVGVETPRGRIEAGSVIVATNAWAPTLLPDLPEGALVPARGQILVTEPVAPVLPYPFGTNFDKEYGRQTPTGQVLCGGYRRLDENEGLGLYEEKVTPPVLQGIAHTLATLFPPLRRLRVVRAWAGIMGFTADGLPLLGAYGSVHGLYVAAGFNGGGFSWGAAVGKAMAQLLCLGQSAFDLEPFDPNRFARGGVTWANPFTAGERTTSRAPRPS